MKFKTKNSFTTKEAELADETVGSADRYNWIKKLLMDGFTPTFEITSAKYPIVLLYKKSELTLLHIRENITGYYLSEHEILGMTPPFELVENVQHLFTDETNVVQYSKLKEYKETATHVEGVVIQFSQDMVKLKTDWYSELHHSVTFTRWRDIARTVCADTADDLKGAFATSGRSIEPILIVQRDIAAKIKLAHDTVNAQVEDGRTRSATQKEMAVNLKGHELFSQIMNIFNGKEVDWLQWYSRKHLDLDWNLEVIENESELVE